MKKTLTAESHPTVDEMRTEYRFDYQQARPNRFAGQTKDRVVVVLDPDISRCLRRRKQSIPFCAP